MPFVTFTERFDFEQQPGVTIAYPAGYTGIVTTACVLAAGGRCINLDKPPEIKVGINETIRSGRAKRNRRV